MVSMSVFGAMGAAVSIGGRIAGERQAGWTRQLRLTPMPGRMYVVSKAVTALAVAVPALALVYAVGAIVEGVRLPAARWAEAAGWSLLALAPFVALGIWLGHRLTVDVLGPLSGALFTALGILGGVWFPIDQLPSVMQGVAKALPSYWLAQAGREPLAGSWIGWHGVTVLAIWTAVFAVLGARAYRRTPREPRFDTVATRAGSEPGWGFGFRPGAGIALGPIGRRLNGRGRWRFFAGIWLLYLLPGFASAWTEHSGVDRVLRLALLVGVLLRLRRPGRPGADRAGRGCAGPRRRCSRRSRWPWSPWSGRTRWARSST